MTAPTSPAAASQGGRSRRRRRDLPHPRRRKRTLRRRRLIHVPASELLVTKPAGDEDEGLSDLARRAGAGDDGAFAKLTQRLDSRIRRWARTLSADADAADDLTQLTLIRLHERVGQFDRRSRLTSWLYRVMRNIAADGRRADARRAARERCASAELTATSATDEQDDSGDARLAALFASYRTALTTRERAVFELVDLQGTAATEVAAHLCIAPATARVLLLRARRKMRTLMLQDLPDTRGGA